MGYTTPCPWATVRRWSVNCTTRSSGGFGGGLGALRRLATSLRRLLRVHDHRLDQPRKEHRPVRVRRKAGAVEGRRATSSNKRANGSARRDDRRGQEHERRGTR